MESKNDLDISVDIPNYSGPLQTLLDLAKNQKVDLTQISVTLLADHFLDYIKKAKITNVAFDRSGYRYHGRVKAVAEALRDKGVKI